MPLSFKEPITLKIPAPGGVKSITINFPSDEHLDQWQRSRSVSVKGNQEKSNENPGLDAEIFREIKISGDDLEASECTWLLKKLSSVVVTDGGRTESGFFVEIEFQGHAYRHEIPIPSADQLRRYHDRVMTSASTRYGGYTYTTHLKPGRELWDALGVTVSGYADDGYIPITHKAMAIAEVSSLVEREVSVTNPPQAPATKP